MTAPYRLLCESVSSLGELDRHFLRCEVVGGRRFSHVSSTHRLSRTSALPLRRSLWM